jgi:Domain of unknown function (DUF1788)
MDKVDQLLAEYQRQLSLPWRRDLSGPERVWIAVYPPAIERRLRVRIPEFETPTRDVHRRWVTHDLTSAFADWLSRQEYREAYFEQPELIAPALDAFATELTETVRNVLRDPANDEDTIVALSGVGALFPMVRVSALIQSVAPHVRGRLLVFFPGTNDARNYRLLDARDGWNYLAVPITISEGASR